MTSYVVEWLVINLAENVYFEIYMRDGATFNNNLEYGSVGQEEINCKAGSKSKRPLSGLGPRKNLRAVRLL